MRFYDWLGCGNESGQRAGEDKQRSLSPEINRGRAMGLMKRGSRLGEPKQNRMEKLEMETSFYTQWGNFVIRKGSTVIGPDSPIRSSFNAEKITIPNHPELGVYEIRMTVRSTTTNYEEGAK
jgi:hypothetical protein